MPCALCESKNLWHAKFDIVSLQCYTNHIIIESTASFYTFCLVHLNVQQHSVILLAVVFN